MLSRGLHEQRALSVKLCKRVWIDFGHLKECDTEAGGEETEDHGDQSDGRGFEALV